MARMLVADIRQRGKSVPCALVPGEETVDRRPDEKADAECDPDEAKALARRSGGVLSAM